MSQFWSKIVRQLTPYIPGEQPKINKLIKLNTNESPYPPSPKVSQRLKEFNSDQLRLYPDPNSEALKHNLARYFNLQNDQIFVGNGSDEVLAFCFLGLLKKEKPLLFPDITYSFYPVYCKLYQINWQTIALDQNFAINPKDYLVTNGGIIIANPNAPTGQLLSLDAIETILKSNPDSVVVIDEAYIDFGGDSAVQLINNYPNLLVIQTFSKSRALAGARVGFALGQKHLIEALERIKNSFNSYPLDSLATQMAIAALDDDDYFLQITQKIIASRENLMTFLTQNEFDVIPSKANFVFAQHATLKAEFLAQKLREENIIVRYFNVPKINNHLRITIGNETEIEALKAMLTKILN